MSDNTIVLLGKDSESSLCEESRRLNAHENDINCIRWNPSNERNNIIASTGDDGKVKIWRLVL